MSQAELAQSARAAAPRDWTRIALALLLATVAYNLIEAGLALWSGPRAA